METEKGVSGGKPKGQVGTSECSQIEEQCNGRPGSLVGVCGTNKK